MQTHDIKDAGPGPIISNICQQLGLKEAINSAVPWDEKQCLSDPGTHVTALIINILCRRDPLYRVERFYREQDAVIYLKGEAFSLFRTPFREHTLVF